MKLYYIANARMPTDKAHGIQIAKMCEALIEQGVDLTLVVPRRIGSGGSLRDFYELRVDIPVVYLPVLDWHDKNTFQYRLSALSFICAYLWYGYTAINRNDALIYTVDLDYVSYLGLPLLGLPYFSEMHGGKPDSIGFRFFFKHVRGIIATTSITRAELIKQFHLPREHTILEPNGVDILEGPVLTRNNARIQLGLPADMTLALYVGRALGWKGLSVLPEAAQALPGVTIGFLGATKEEFARVAEGTSFEPLVFYGSATYSEVRLWLAAADLCIVLGTKHDTYSYRYTSPMKLYEYLASGRPIIASATPALKSVVSDEECFFCEPDDAASLVAAIRTAVDDPQRRARVAAAGLAHAREHTWTLRAKRTVAFIEHSLAQSI